MRGRSGQYGKRLKLKHGPPVAENYLKRRNKMGFYVYILGAKDSEMDAIESVLKAEGLPYGYALNGKGQRVFPAEAYKFSSQSKGTINDAEEFFYIECAPVGFKADADHHNKGDRGFGLPAHQAVAASSLGQVCEHLGIEMTQEQRVVAAADHNLRAAYEGRVPGVSAEEVLALRGKELAARYSTDIEGFAAGVYAAAELLKNAPKILVGGEEVADVRECGVQSFMIDASLLSGIPAIGRTDARQPEKVFLSAPGQVVEHAKEIEGPTWALVDPAREFATGIQ